MASTFFNDTFTEASDTPLESHTSDSGHTYRSGSYEQAFTVYSSGDVVRREGTGTGGRNIAVVSCTPPSADHVGYCQGTMGAVGASTVNNFGLYIRSDDYFFNDAEYYSFQIRSETGWYLTYDESGSTIGTLASDSTYVGDQSLTGSSVVTLKIQVETINASTVRFNGWIDIDAGGYSQIITNVDHTDNQFSTETVVTKAGNPNFYLRDYTAELTRVWYETSGTNETIIVPTGPWR